MPKSQRKKSEKVPSHPYIESARPTKYQLENLTVASRSFKGNNCQWTVQDQVLLIRARECCGMSWDDIAKLFPNKHGFSVERRYKKYLVKSENDPDISVADRLLPTIPLDPPNVPYKASSAKIKNAVLPNSFTRHHELEHEHAADSYALESEPSDVEEVVSDKTLQQKVEKVTPAMQQKGKIVKPAQRERGYGPLKWSRRPDKQEIETIVLTTEKSPAAEGTPWGLHDDIRLIRLKECAKLRWNQIASYFPNRKNDAAEKRYVDYLRASKTDPPILVPQHLVYPGQELPPESLMQTLIRQGQSILSSANITTIVNASKPVDFHNALIQARATLPQTAQHSSMDLVPFATKLDSPGFHVDSPLKHAMTLIENLDQEQSGKVFDGEKIISLRTLLSELDYEESMNNIGYPTSYFEPEEDHKISSIFSCILESSLQLTDNEDDDHVNIKRYKLRAHDEVSMIIGISRKSSFPSVDYEKTVTTYRQRCRQYVQFYLDRCHVGRRESCCEPRRETVVIFGSSNNDFDISNAYGVQELRSLLQQLQPREKVVLVSSQTDGISTNMLGFEAFMKPFLSKGIDVDLLVWWSNEKCYTYNVQTLLDQLCSKIFGGPLDPYYQEFLSTAAGIANNKNVMAAASRANKQLEGLGLRNAKYIEAKDYEVVSEKEFVASRKAPRQLRDTPRSVKEVVLAKTEHGKFISPTDDSTIFDTTDEVAKHITDLIMQLPQQERRCFFCDNTFYQYVRNGPILNHVRRHIFEEHQCPCGYSAKTAKDLAAHQEQHKNEGKVECSQCHVFFEKYRLAMHIRDAHVRSEQVTLFGEIMGVKQWALQ